MTGFDLTFIDRLAKLRKDLEDANLSMSMKSKTITTKTTKRRLLITKEDETKLREILAKLDITGE